LTRSNTACVNYKTWLGVTRRVLIIRNRNYLSLARTRVHSRSLCPHCVSRLSILDWFGLWCLTPLSTIFQLYRRVLLVEKNAFKWKTQRKQPTCRKSLTNFITQYCIEYTWSWMGLEFTTLVVVGTDCTCKSNYHMITTAPFLIDPLGFSNIYL
jgi:hypothetical protein